MPNTSELPGVQGEGVSVKKIKALDTAIDEWRDIVTKRMALTKKEVAAAENVRVLMHKHEVQKYPYTQDDEEKLVVLVGKEKVKLQSAEKPDEPEEE